MTAADTWDSEEVVAGWLEDAAPVAAVLLAGELIVELVVVLAAAVSASAACGCAADPLTPANAARAGVCVGACA
jgi:hypothetical protein